MDETTNPVLEKPIDLDRVDQILAGLSSHAVSH